MLRCILLVACLFSLGVSALDTDTFKNSCQIYGPLGGWYKESGAELELGTQLVQLPDGRESWEGCLMAKRRIEVIPGRSYTWEVDFYGSGFGTVGVFEHPAKHSPSVIGRPAIEVELAPDLTTCRFTYTPTSERVMYVSPFIQVTGWHCRARIKRVEFKPAAVTGQVSLDVNKRLIATGDTLEVDIEAAAFPLTLLLYGPDGTVGLNLPHGGHGAFSDHFIEAIPVEASPVAVPVPPVAHEGSYRVMVVDPRTNAVDTERITIRPAEQLAQDLAILQRLNLEPGSRLLFLGDSLTANFPGRNYPALIQRACRERFGDQVEVINAGVGGDNILRLAQRLERDVVSQSPTHVFLFEGANDCKVRFDPESGETKGWAVPPDRYEATYRDVLQQLKATGARVIVATCAPGNPLFLERWEREARLFGDVRNFFCRPDEVGRLVAIQKRLAAELDCELVDTHALLSGMETIHVDDGVHLNEFGAREVARIFMAYLADHPD